MKTDRALELLDARRSEFAAFACVAGTRGDVAFLRANGGSDQGPWAMLSTPGDRWVSLDIDGGYSVDHFEEGTSDADVVQMIDLYVEAALAYLRGEVEVSPGRVLALRTVAVRTSEGRLVLRRSLAGVLKALVRREAMNRRAE